MRLSEDSIQSLIALGFTGLEAEVYAFLLQSPPATGYRVAQAIGKPVANTYKAIESLESKGAVLVQEGANRLYRAVPSEELLSQLERNFLDRRLRAAQALAELHESPEDDRIYQLRSREQALQRCRSMLARCRKTAVLDIFPEPLEELRPDIAAAMARGVDVAILTYQPVEFSGARVFDLSEQRGHVTMRHFPGQWVELVTDGAELLLAFLTRDGRDIHQAIWSSSVFLALALHSAIWSEGAWVMMIRQLDEGTTVETLKETVEKFGYIFSLTRVPGFQMLQQRFGEGLPDNGCGSVSPPDGHDKAQKAQEKLDRAE